MPEPDGPEPDRPEHRDKSAGAHVVSAEGWRGLVILSFLGALLVGGLVASLGIYAPAIVQAGDQSHLTMGAAGTATLIGVSVTSILAGVAIERLAAPLVIGAGLVLSVAGCVASSLATGQPVFVGGFLLIGAGMGFATTVPGIALIARWFGGRRGFALGLYFAALAVSAAVIPVGVSAAISQWGWQATMQGIALATATGLFLLPFLTSGKGAADADDAQTSDRSLSPLAALRNTGVWRTGIAIILSQYTTQCVLFTVVGHLTGHGFGLTTATTIYGAANLVTAPAVIAAGALADRFGAARVLVPAFFLQAIGTAVLAATVSSAAMQIAILAVFILCWGASSSVALQTGPVLLHQQVGERHYASILSVVIATTGLIGALAPFTSSLVRDMLGSYHAVYLWCGALAVIAAIAIPRTAPRLILPR